MTELALPEVASTAAHFDPYAALSRSERRTQLRRVLEVLRARSGTLDFAQRRLSKREAFFASLPAGAVWRSGLDRDGLRAALERRAPAPADPRALWLFVAAKASESEAYGVDLEVRRRQRKGAERSPEDQLYLLLEECYHPRILDEICRACGVELGLARPPLAIRILIHLFEFIPDPIRYVGVLSGEVLGCVVFAILAEHTHLFRDEPDVEARLEALLGEILRDEVWHVLLCRAQLGPLRMWLARGLAPLVVRILMHEIPELAQLGCTRSELLRRMRAGLPVPPGLGPVSRG